jgi:hypothetical protein
MKDVDYIEAEDIVETFLQELASHLEIKQGLQIKLSSFSILGLINSSFQITDEENWEDQLVRSDRFDMIFADLPIVRSTKYDCVFDGKKVKLRANWIEILKAVRYISDDGVAVFLTASHGFGNTEGVSLEHILNSAGYYVNAIFNTSEVLSKHTTAMIPVLIVVSMRKTESIFVAELLNSSNAQQVASNYLSNIVSNNLVQGMEIESKSFNGFDRIKVKQQIEILETYKGYEGFTIDGVAKEIYYVKKGESFEENPNCVYIPKVGNSPVITTLDAAELKPYNYFQVVLDEQKAFNEYVAAFFQSELGKFVLTSLMSETVIKHINRKILKKAEIALPTLEKQNEIVATQKKIAALKVSIDLFNRELALNPKSANRILNPLDNMLDLVGKLTDADNVRKVIRQGESKNLEFKETLSLDISQDGKSEEIELSALKTIMAFLNTDGGTLLIGIADSSEITGVDLEIEKFHNNSNAQFLNHFKECINTKIEPEFYDHIDCRLIDTGESHILSVQCKSARNPCYFNKSDLYVRTNQTTDKLDGPGLVAYVNNRF